MYSLSSTCPNGQSGSLFFFLYIFSITIPILFLPPTKTQQAKELLEEEVHRLRRSAEESGNGLKVAAGGRSRIQALEEELARARSEIERLVALLQRGDQEMAVLREKHEFIANWETQITGEQNIRYYYHIRLFIE